MCVYDAGEALGRLQGLGDRETGVGVECAGSWGGGGGGAREEGVWEQPVVPSTGQGAAGNEPEREANRGLGCCAKKAVMLLSRCFV